MTIKAKVLTNRYLAATAFVTLLAATVVETRAADFSDPDWPCVQRKVPHLAVGQMWAGAPISETDLADWRNDEAVAALAPVLAIRRTAEEDADEFVAAFADGLSDDRNRRLALLFAGAFSLLDAERSTIIAGIGRYARHQIALSQSIEDTQNRLTELNKAAEPDLDTIEELEDKVLWDTRIYKDRAQSLTYVCETPVILERRAFALARMIQSHLE